MPVHERCSTCRWYKHAPDRLLVGRCDLHQLDIVTGLQTACDEWEPREAQLTLPGVKRHDNSRV